MSMESLFEKLALVRKSILSAAGLPASTEVTVNNCRNGFYYSIDIPNLQHCPCGTKTFNVTHHIIII